jgi:CAAX prenyl protease-like protein
MQCSRCETVFEGRFCPRCGAPASPAERAPAETVIASTAPSGSWPCPRCGTPYYGNFCPRCGLPTAAWAFRQAPPRSSGGRAVLSILWTLALIAFLVFAATDFAGLAVSPTLVVPGIQGIRSGQTANAGLDVDQRNWTGNSWGTGSSLTYENAGGHPDGYLKMTLFAPGSRGYWIQPFRVEGMTPFATAVRLDVEVLGGLSDGYLFVSVDSGSPSDPDPNTAIAAVPFTGPTSWTSVGPLRNDTRVLDAGVYYLKIAFVANATSGPLEVGLDNVRLSWTTDAGVVFYLPAPYPVRIFASQDKVLFLSYYSLIVAAIFLVGGYHAFRERKETWNAFRAPVDAIGTRLRARSAWIAVAQVWMAVTFFQVVVILFLPVIGIEPTTPINIDSRNTWALLFDLANAGVYEEIVFRLLLIGVPMALGSVALRFLEVNRGTASRLPGSGSRYIAGAWRYLFGGVLRRGSSKEAHVAAWAFLVGSAAIFGLAHVPGWGWWKAVPTFVAGLGFGYLFLRHGIGAAILAHFVNDYALSLYYEGIGGTGLMNFIELLFVGLAIAGAGFFIWYSIDAVRHLGVLIGQFRPPPRVRPASRPLAPLGTLPPIPDATRVLGPPTTTRPANPDPAFGTWSPTPSPQPAANAVRDPGRIPRDYAPSYVPPPYGYPPVRFQCPSCGWVEARYDTGRFTCTRCGRTA